MSNFTNSLVSNIANMRNKDIVTYFQKLYIASGKELNSFFSTFKEDILHTFMKNTTNSVLLSNCFYTKLCDYATSLNYFLWAFYRKVYVFNENWVSLFSESDILKMAGYKFKELISTLAYHSFYIKDNKNMNTLFNFISDTKYDGFFVSVFNIDFISYISVSPCNKQNKSDKGIVFSIDNRYNVELNLKRNLDMLLQGQSSHIKDFNLTQNLQHSFVCFIQYILYLSVANNTKHGEIEYRTAKDFSFINSDKDSITCFLKDVKEGADITIIDVETPSISYNQTFHSTGITKCSHTRRGHPHRYWVGHGENKTLIEKFVGATVINEGKTTLIKVVHNVI